MYKAFAFAALVSLTLAGGARAEDAAASDLWAAEDGQPSETPDGWLIGFPWLDPVGGSDGDAEDPVVGDDGDVVAFDGGPEDVSETSGPESFLLSASATGGDRAVSAGRPQATERRYNSVGPVQANASPTRTVFHDKTSRN